MQNKIYFVQWTGGEPMLHPELLNILSYAKKLNISSSLSTNGLLLNENNLGDYCALVSDFTLSLDGTKFSNNFLRGCFSHVNNVLHLLKKMNIRYSINATISKLNLNDLEFITDIAFDNNASSVRLNAVNQLGRAKNCEKEILDCDDLLFIKRKSRESTEKYNYKLIVLTNIFTKNEFNLYADGIPFAITNSIWIDTDFSVSYFPPTQGLKYQRCFYNELCDSEINRAQNEIKKAINKIKKEKVPDAINIYEKIQSIYLDYND